MLVLGIVAGFSFHADSRMLFCCLVSLVLLTLSSFRWAMLQTGALSLSILVLGMLLATRERQSAEDYSYDRHERPLRLVVVSEPVEKAKTYAFDVYEADEGRKLKCYVQKDPRSRRLSPGDGLEAMTMIRSTEGYRSGRFDYHHYLLRQGFSGQCYVRAEGWHHDRVGLSHLSSLQRSRITFLRWRHRLLEKYRLLGAAADRYAVLSAMTLGDKSALSRQLQDTYSVAGASHVLALSGLHLGILYFLLSWLLSARGRPGGWSRPVLVACVWAFAMLAGLPLSLVRSALMLSVFAVFSLGGRGGTTLNSLCFAAIVILVVSPAALYDVGFQLSFLSVLGILLVVPLLDSWTSDEWMQRHTLPRLLWGCLAVSLAAQVGTAPLVAYYFGRLPVYFLLTNLVVLPCAYAILLGSLLMLVVQWMPLATMVLSLVDLLNETLALLGRLPHASIEGLHPSALQVILIYVAIGCFYGALLRLTPLRLHR